MDILETPADVIEHHWQWAGRELDNPHACRFGMIFSGGSPAWPIEYALRLVATDGQATLTMDDSCRELGGTTLVATLLLLGFYTRFRAALYRVPHYPDPVLPQFWPRHPGTRLLGRGGASALEVAARVLQEIDGGIGRGSGHALRLESEDGKPAPVDPEAPLEAEAYVTWFQRSMDELRRLVLTVFPSVDVLEPEISGLLPILEEEHRQWRDGEARGTEPKAQAKQKSGSTKWGRARLRMIHLLKQKRLPKTLRDTARLLKPEGFKYNTVRDAAHKSPLLVSHFDLNEQGAPAQADKATGALLEELAEQADHRAKQLIQSLSPETKRQFEAEVVNMDRDEALEMIRTLAENPDGGSSGDVPFIEGADSDGLAPDCPD